MCLTFPPRCTFVHSAQAQAQIIAPSNSVDWCQEAQVSVHVDPEKESAEP